MRNWFAPSQPRKHITFASVALLAVTGMLAIPTLGNAAYLDLTNPLAGPGNEATRQGFRGTGAGGAQGLFIHSIQGGGVGNFPTFAEIGGNKDQVKGYNTTVNGTFDIGSSDIHNHGIQVKDVGTVVINGVTYFQFALDINESDGGNPGAPDNRFLSLDALKIFTNNVANPSTTDLTQLGTQRFELGAGNNILLDFQDASGSGTSDLLVHIPVWANADPEDWIHLYSEFGALGSVTDGSAPTGNYGNSDGFEHWGHREGDGGSNHVVPLPGSIVMALSGLGMLGVGGWIRRRRVKSS